MPGLGPDEQTITPADLKPEHKPEPKPEPEPDNKPKPDESVTRTQAELERKDRELWQKTQELKQIKERADEMERLKQIAAQDPLSAVRQLGVDPISIAERLINDDGETKKPDSEIMQLRQQITELKESLQNQQQQTNIQNMKARIRAEIMQKSEQYPMLAQMAMEGDGVVDTVFNRAASIYDRTGVEKPWSEILDETNTEYKKGLFDALKKYKKAGMFRDEELKAIVGNETSVADNETTFPASQQQQQSQTLSGDLSGDIGRIKNIPSDPDEAERVAIEFLNKKLKEG